jgi:N-terminal acetyltransferase B complex non-catalytic subunit
MALNWEKLQKLQRDYPKPKFAEKEITRQLKKKPKDPYLLVMEIG